MVREPTVDRGFTDDQGQNHVALRAASSYRFTSDTSSRYIDDTTDCAAKGFPQFQKELEIFHFSTVATSGADRVCYSNDTGDPSPAGIKRPGTEADCSPHLIPNLRMSGA